MASDPEGPGLGKTRQHPPAPSISITLELSVDLEVFTTPATIEAATEAFVEWLKDGARMGAGPFEVLAVGVRDSG